MLSLDTGRNGLLALQPPFLLTIDNTRKNIDIGKLVGAIFIDLTKAFDTVSHSVL